MDRDLIRRFIAELEAAEATEDLARVEQHVGEALRLQLQIRQRLQAFDHRLGDLQRKILPHQQRRRLALGLGPRPKW